MARALERKEDGAWLGQAGFWNPPGWPGLEVGWKLVRDAWGRGYATEAGQAAIEWAWGNLDAAELISVIQPGNAASIRVAEQLGMQRLRARQPSKGRMWSSSGSTGPSSDQAVAAR